MSGLKLNKTVALFSFLFSFITESGLDNLETPPAALYAGRAWKYPLLCCHTRNTEFGYVRSSDKNILRKIHGYILYRVKSRNPLYHIPLFHSHKSACLLYSILYGLPTTDKTTDPCYDNSRCELQVSSMRQNLYLKICLGLTYEGRRDGSDFR
jgi:hypothetical protein